MESHTERIQRLMRTTPRPEAIRMTFEVHLIDFVEDGHHGLLNNFVLQRRHNQSELHWSTTHIWDGLRSVTPITHFGASSFEYSSSDA